MSIITLTSLYVDALHVERQPRNEGSRVSYGNCPNYYACKGKNSKPKTKWSRCGAKARTLNNH